MDRKQEIELAMGSALYEANQCGCDALNAFACGLVEFEDFVGLEEIDSSC